MTEDDGTCGHLAQLPKLPEPTELEKRRRNGWKKRRKIKHPPIRILDGRHSLLGWFQFESRGEDYLARFCSGVDGKVVEALLSDLCDREELAEKRLHLGWLIADMYDLDGLHLMHSIPGPREAMSESAPFFKTAELWRRWGVG